ncbi:MAG: thiamine phosphate synthase, partial [Planctomycetes bacterium]|nr:thiamine phosphate synthase [Planctomycetota bacterium]
MRFIFTAAAERALDNASGWSLGSARGELEAESLLLGLLSEPECRAAAMLTRVGVDISVVRKQWTALVYNGPSEEGCVRRKLFSSDLVCSFQLASERLACLPQPLELATEHILLGLTAADHDVSVWLRRQGLDPDSLAAEIQNLHGFPAEEESCRELVASDEFSPGTCAGHDNRLAADGTSAQTSMIDTLRVIDAAANRAREGLRVIEDYARLVLDDRHLTQLCKQMRHDLADCLAAASMDRRLAARETRADVGTTLDVPTEGRRENPLDVPRANFARLQEALRSLEEFGKLFDSNRDCWGGSCTTTPGATVQLSPQPANLAATAKQLRYSAYTLERAVGITGRSIERLDSARLYVLLDGRRSPEEFERLVRSLIEAGADILQLRDKRLGDRELLARGRLLVAATRGSGTLAIVNDRPDLAAL